LLPAVQSEPAYISRQLAAYKAHPGIKWMNRHSFSDDKHRLVQYAGWTISLYP